MKNNHKIKLIAASLALTSSFSALAGLGGLNVQSNLGEPFSGTVTVTGEEAKILLNGGSAAVSDGNLRTSVRKSGNNAVINIRSNAPVNDPVLVFQVGVGSQSRQYTAIIDPADYPADSSGSTGAQADAGAQAAETTSHQENTKNSAAKAKLKAKRTQEQQARAEQRREQQKAAASNRAEKAQEQAVAERKPAPVSGNYKVRRGETLTSIAAQVRPSGLSVYETISAIMTANPEIFPTRNANQILAGRVLHIPPSEELKRLAKQKAPAAPEQAAQVSQPDTAAQASAPSGTAAASAPTSGASDTAAPPAQASAVETTSEASVPQASASAVEASEPASAPAAAQPQEPSSSESIGWWRWLLFAGLGAIALWLLLKLAGKKKAAIDNTTVTTENNDIVIKDDAATLAEDDEPFDRSPEAETDSNQTEIEPETDGKPISSLSVTAVAAATTAAAVASTATTQSKDGELDIEDDFDDDIFFSEAETKPVEQSESNFNLDLSSIDREQGSIVSGALTQDEETQQREHADWDNIESTESVYEPETESEFQHIAVEFDAGSDTETHKEADDAVTFSTESEAAADSDAPLEFHAEQEPVEPVSAQTIAVETEESELVQIETASVSESAEIQPLEFEAVPAAADEIPEAEQAFNVKDDFQTAETDFPASTPTEPVLATDDTAVAADTTEKNLPQDEGFAFQDGEDFETTINLTEENAGTIEWESINVEESRSTDGFISESVGMTAPLEAKYELAQMYVEIGDPEAAKETLQELLEESNGEILEKTKAMLAELDK